MRKALTLAKLGEGQVEPNPMVGCAIVQSGELVGEGYHEFFGGPHAEINAIHRVEDPARLRGATAYVTLEPCCHHGKTPPCTQAIIEAGITRVFVATSDPFPLVDGGGLQQLRQQGIDVNVGILQAEAKDLIAPFTKLVCSKKPWVIAKWAMTIDGRIATRTGASQWITCEASRREVHRLRGRVDAIAVGMGTVSADNPLLTARPTGPRVARRVVYCDNRLPGNESLLIRTATEVPVTLVLRRNQPETLLQPLRDAGVAVIDCSTVAPSETISRSLLLLGESKLTNLMLEGGGKLLGSFHDAQSIDEYHVYIGSKSFGGIAAPGPIGGEGVSILADCEQLRIVSVDRFDEDVRLIYRREAT